MATSGRTVREIMSTDLQIASPDDLVSKVAMKMRDASVGAVLVADHNGFLGILTDRDIVVRLVAAGQNPARYHVRDVYSDGDLTTIGPNDSLEGAVALMVERDVRRLPVCEGPTPIGIVSRSDLDRALRAELVHASN